MKYSIIDIGSNTIRLNIYSVDENKKIISLLNKKKVAGLSSYVEKGNMTQKGADKLIGTLKSFIKISDFFQIENIYMFATAALRNANNSKEILNYVEDSIGYKIDLIPGEEEARLGYIGVLQDYQIENGYILDIGGGSVEITLVKNKEIIYTDSLPEGSLSTYKKYVSRLFPNDIEIKNIKNAIKEELTKHKVPVLDENLPIYGIGGTIRACGNISQEFFNLETNTRLTEDHLKKLRKNLKEEKQKLLNVVLQVVPERIHTISTGSIILYEVFKYLKAKEIYISKNGVRDGYLWEKINKN